MAVTYDEMDGRRGDGAVRLAAGRCGWTGVRRVR